MHPNPLYLTREQVREVDRHAIEDLGIPGIVLMENASRGAVEVMRSMGLRAGQTVLILCGPGNNGGDGFGMARHLHLLGCRVRLLITRHVADLQGDAAAQARIVQTMGLPTRHLDEAYPLAKEIEAVDWIVDALLGTGFEGELQEPLLSLVMTVNHVSGQRSLPVLAVDIPSGLNANTGDPGIETIRAAHTVTFVAPKTGFQAGAAREFLGRVHTVGIGAPIPTFPS